MVLDVKFYETNSWGDWTQATQSALDTGQLDIQEFTASKTYFLSSTQSNTELKKFRPYNGYHLQLYTQRTGTLGEMMTVFFQVDGRTVYNIDLDPNLYSNGTAQWWTIPIPEWHIPQKDFRIGLSYKGFTAGGADYGTLNHFKVGVESLYGSGLSFKSYLSKLNSAGQVADNLNFASVNSNDVAEYTYPVKRGTNSYWKMIRFDWQNNMGTNAYIKAPRFYRSDNITLPTGVTLTAERVDEFKSPNTTAVGSAPPTTYDTGIMVIDYSKENTWTVGATKRFTSPWWIRLQMQVASNASLGRVPSTGEFKWTLQWDEW